MGQPQNDSSLYSAIQILILQQFLVILNVGFKLREFILDDIFSILNGSELYGFIDWDGGWYPEYVILVTEFA